MIKVYLDWNVISQMRNGKHTRLSNILADNNKFFKVFSTSHISDIASSNSIAANHADIQADLDYISDFTQDSCVFNDGKEILIDKYSPHEIYNERTDVKDVLESFDFNGILKTIGGDNEELQSVFKPWIDSLLNLPVDKVFEDAFNNPETEKQIRQFLPGLEDNYTMQGLFNAMITMFMRLNEHGDYKQLREMLQNGLKINRDKMFASEDPYKSIERAYQNFGSLPELPDNGKNSPAWFSELTNEYLKLDMHGYQEDKVNVQKGRKETFRNTTEDAFHTAFATTCDFYITDDNRNRRKAAMVYKRLGINTLVLSSLEFVEHYDQYLHFKEGNQFIGLVSAFIKHGEPFMSEDGQQKIYFLPVFIFDYFNKIYLWRLENTGQNTLMLSREKPTNNRFTYEKELVAIIDKLRATFGEDVEQLKGFQEAEIPSLKSDSWPGRKWLNDGVVYHLRMLRGYLQLYVNELEVSDDQKE